MYVQELHGPSSHGTEPIRSTATHGIRSREAFEDDKTKDVLMYICGNVREELKLWIYALIIPLADPCRESRCLVVSLSLSLSLSVI